MPGNKHKSGKKTQPIQEKDIQKNPDKHIDQDFEGFPHLPSKEETIRPNSKTEKLNAGLLKNESDGTRSPRKSELRKELEDTDEQDSDGSGGAFSGTEEILPPEQEEDDNEKIY